MAMKERKDLTQHLTAHEIKTICDFVATTLKKGDRWMLFSYNPNADVPIGFAAPSGINPKDMLRIAAYLLKSAAKDIK